MIHQELQGDQLQTWVVRKGEVQFVATTAGATLVGDIARFRTNPSVIDARNLHEVLLRPVQQHVGNADQIIYSPGRALRGVPFAVLHDGTSFVVERNTVIIAPSISAVMERFGRRPRSGGSALITLPPPAEGSVPLPGAREEARVIAQTYGARGTSLFESEGSKDFLEMVPLFDTIHIGTHGHDDTRPLLSAIEFGRDRLHAWEVMQLRLTRNPVVILAGCRTADETAGHAMIGLSSAFIAAGASSVVGSLWDVEDRSTARLMIDFHQHLAQGVSAAEALALAQRSAIASKEPISTWAAFQVQM